MVHIPYTRLWTQVLERCMMEALRLFPPLIMLLRQAKAPFAVTTSQGKTHVIPKVQAPGRTPPAHLL